MNRVLADKAVAGFKVKRLESMKSCHEPDHGHRGQSDHGYEKSAKIAKKAYQQGRPVIDVALEHTELSRSQLEELLNPEKLTAGGV